MSNQFNAYLLQLPGENPVNVVETGELELPSAAQGKKARARRLSNKNFRQWTARVKLPTVA